MSGWIEFALAYAVFLLTHAIPMRPQIKARLESAFDARGYLIGYASVSIIMLGWLIHAAGRAPYVPVWGSDHWQVWMPNLAMPFACLLLVFGLRTPNPLSLGGTHSGDFHPDRPGIAGVARHPVLWALALWAGSHLVANGDLAHVFLFGGFVIMALLGMSAIDRRNRRVLGNAAWEHLAARTSSIPLSALVGGRWTPRAMPDVRRFAIAIAVWAALLAAHRSTIGVSPLP